MRARSGAADSRRSRPLEQAKLYRLGVWGATRPLKIIGVWAVLFVCAALSAGYFTAHLRGTDNTVTGSDSQKAQRLVEKKFPGTPDETDFVVVHSRRLTVDDAAFRRVVDDAVARFEARPVVRNVTSPYAAPQRLVSTDRRTALVPVGLNGSDKELVDAAGPLQDAAKALRTDAVEVYFTGRAPLSAASSRQSAQDLSRAESIGLPAAALVLVIAFGSLVAAAIPLVLGSLAVLAAFGVLGIVSIFAPFDVFVQTAVSMVGIALGIDYSLFIVTRFREELARATGDAREDVAQAVGRTAATAGGAVLFSGVTVLVSLLGLWLVRSPKVHSMAMGMTAAVAVMLSISVLLLPAILGLLGSRINRLAVPWARSSLAHPDPEHSIWARIVTTVMRRPAVVAVVAVLVLGALAIPVFGLRYGVDLGATTLADSPAGRGYGIVSKAFEPGVLSPVNVVVSTGTGAFTDAQLEAVARFSAEAGADDRTVDVVSVTGVLDAQLHGHTARDLQRAAASAGALDGIVSRDGTTSVIAVRPRFGADTARTAKLVRQLRTVARERFAGTGLEVEVGGAPAEIVDITDESKRALPVVIITVLAASWLLLLVAFRSVVLPFKAILMNLLTSGAAFGVAVLIFQDGHGAALFGVERTGFIQVILPLFSFALVFGLSMDYEVFMLSRMREEWERTGDNGAAVRLGITRTARVITAAAAIMVVVFASFMFTRILEIKQLGFMLGLAVLIDASIVRLLLVPALMKLMGSWNWWIPRWLARVLPNVATEH